MANQQIIDFTENGSPDNWLKYAEELNRVVELLWNEKEDFILDIDEDRNTKRRPAISRMYMLSCGLSIENLLKAFVVAIDPSVINTGVLDKKLKEHDLVKLSKFCEGINFEETEVELLKILSEAIPYWGRYPIPLHFQSIKKEKVVGENIDKVYKQLFNKIFQATYYKIKDGWDAGNGVSFGKFDYKNF